MIFPQRRIARKSRLASTGLDAAYVDARVQRYAKSARQGDGTECASKQSPGEPRKPGLSLDRNCIPVSTWDRSVQKNYRPLLIDGFDLGQHQPPSHERGANGRWWRRNWPICFLGANQHDEGVSVDTASEMLNVGRATSPKLSLCKCAVLLNCSALLSKAIGVRLRRGNNPRRTTRTIASLPNLQIRRMLAAGLKAQTSATLAHA